MIAVIIICLAQSTYDFPPVQGTVAENLASRLDPAKKYLQERDRLAMSTKVDEDIGFSECKNECPLLS